MRAGWKSGWQGPPDSGSYENNLPDAEEKRAAEQADFAAK